MWYESPNSPGRGKETLDARRSDTARSRSLQCCGTPTPCWRRGKTIGQVCQSLEISEQTFHRWRDQYGGMKAEEAKRLKQLEEENKRLKKLLAEAELDKAILKEALQGNFRALPAAGRRSARSSDSWA